MLAASVRSGLTETYHHGSVAVCRPDGSVVARSGDIHQPYFLRSSAKPFQALASVQSGAALAPVELALACASHRGHPVQVAIVESMLAAGGLGEEDLRCPEDFPLAAPAQRRLLRAGHARPRRIWHNCSGKHAGFLRACVASGWPIAGYLQPDHPLQRRIVNLVSELGRRSVEPVGVDGCGAPVLRTTAKAMATLFASLAVEPTLSEIFSVMGRYPALVSGNGEGDSAIATAIHGAAKGGAQGCIGVALPSGLGVAVKSWDGSHDVAVVGAVAALEALGALSDTGVSRLAPVGRPAVHGGGLAVGSLEPRLDLTFS
ncbi:MAG TPA: asparaginase [Acidimicrobiia bacterium]